MQLMSSISCLMNDADRKLTFWWFVTSSLPRLFPLSDEILFSYRELIYNNGQGCFFIVSVHAVSSNLIYFFMDDEWFSWIWWELVGFLGKVSKISISFNFSRFLESHEYVFCWIRSCLRSLTN